MIFRNLPERQSMIMNETEDEEEKEKKIEIIPTFKTESVIINH